MTKAELRVIARRTLVEYPDIAWVVGQHMNGDLAPAGPYVHLTCDEDQIAVWAGPPVWIEPMLREGGYFGADEAKPAALLLAQAVVIARRIEWTYRNEGAG